MSDTSNTLTSDSSTNTDPFSGGSASPDFWRNLMAFGAATSAAGAKGGATTFGSIGQGVQAAMQNARENGTAKTNQQLTQQEIAGHQIQNAQNMYALQRQNMINQQYGLPTMNLPNIPGLSSQTFQQPMQQAGGVQPPQQVPQAAPSGPSQMPPQGDALNQYRQEHGLPTPPVDTQRANMGLPVGSSTPATDPSSTTETGDTAAPQESAGMAGPTWASTPGNTRVNDKPRVNQYPAGSSGTPAVMPPLAAGNSPAVAGAALQVAQQANNAPAATPASEPQLTNRQIGQMLMSPNSSQMLSQVKDPQNAQRIVKAGADLGINVPTFIGELANAPAKAMSQNVDAREGSIGYNEASGVTATGRLAGMTTKGASFLTPPQVTKNGVSMLPPPEDIKQAPIDAKWPIQEPNPEHPWGLQAGQTLTKVPDWLDQWREKNYPRMADLQTQMQQQSALDDSISKLKNADMLAPGTWAEDRKGLVDMWNTGNRILGTPDHDSEKAAASAAEFIKIAQQNTNASAHEISSKGTNFDIVSAAKANPQYSMPYLSGLITNSMNSEAVARNYNRIQYIDERMNNGVSEADATAEFEQQQPGDMVVKRAESVVDPITVNTPGGLKQLLPGTKYTLPNGKTSYVPIPKDYPFFVPYTNPLVKAQRASQPPEAAAAAPPPQQPAGAPQ
jgi:hypothetical protein